MFVPWFCGDVSGKVGRVGRVGRDECSGGAGTRRASLGFGDGCTTAGDGARWMTVGLPAGAELVGIYRGSTG